MTRRRTRRRCGSTPRSFHREARPSRPVRNPSWGRMPQAEGSTCLNGLEERASCPRGARLLHQSVEAVLAPGHDLVQLVLGKAFAPVAAIAASRAGDKLAQRRHGLCHECPRCPHGHCPNACPGCLPRGPLCDSHFVRSFPYLNGYLQFTGDHVGQHRTEYPTLRLANNPHQWALLPTSRSVRAEFRAPNRRDCTSLSGRKVRVATPDRLDWPKGGGLVEMGSAEQHPRNRGHVERANYLRRGAVRQGAVPPVIDARPRWSGRGGVQSSQHSPTHIILDCRALARRPRPIADKGRTVPRGVLITRLQGIVVLLVLLAGPALMRVEPVVIQSA